MREPGLKDSGRELQPLQDIRKEEPVAGPEKARTGIREGGFGCGEHLPDAARGRPSEPPSQGWGKPSFSFSQVGQSGYFPLNQGLFG